jgi:hypothetical protein
VVRHLTAIEEIVCLLQSVKDHLIVLEATVAEQGHQQQALNLVLTRVEQGQQGGHHAGTDDAADPDGDFIPTAHVLKFPKYDGTRDLLPWLNRYDR